MNIRIENTGIKSLHRKNKELYVSVYTEGEIEFTNLYWAESKEEALEGTLKSIKWLKERAGIRA